MEKIAVKKVDLALLIEKLKSKQVTEVRKKLPAALYVVLSCGYIALLFPFIY